MWFGLTIARSSPASTQWCRKTRVEDARAPAAPTPNETFETPSEVLTPGQLLLDPPDALDRLDRRRPPLLVAGREREREQVEDQQLRVEAVLVARRCRGCAGRSRPCARRSWPCRPRRSSARSARRRAAFASGTTRSALSRPASRLIELTIARPGFCSSAIWMTSGSVESIWIGAGWVSEMRLTTCRICSSSSWRSVSATQRSSTWAPPSTWSSAICTSPS